MNSPENPVRASVLDRVLRPAGALVQRELFRFFRQPSRLVASVGVPVFVVLLLRFGFPQTGGGLPKFFPGAVLMSTFMASVFFSIGIIQDRREGFLAGIMVSRASRMSLLLGRVGGAAIISTAQGLLVVLAGVFLGLKLSVGGFALTVAALLVGSAGLAALGAALAWRMESIQGFHGIVNCVLMPMFVLSGTVFDAGAGAPWLQTLVSVNPMTHAARLLQVGLLPGAASFTASVVAVSASVVVAFSAAALSFGWWISSRPNPMGTT